MVRVMLKMVNEFDDIEYGDGDDDVNNDNVVDDIKIMVMTVMTDDGDGNDDCEGEEDDEGNRFMILCLSIHDNLNLFNSSYTEKTP